MANGERDGSTGPRDATGLDAYGDRVGLLRGSMANGERDGSTGPRDAWVSMHTEIGSACYGEAWPTENGTGVRDLGMQRVSMHAEIGSACYGEAWLTENGTGVRDLGMQRVSMHPEVPYS